MRLIGLYWTRVYQFTAKPPPVKRFTAEACACACISAGLLFIARCSSCISLNI